MKNISSLGLLIFSCVLFKLSEPTETPENIIFHLLTQPFVPLKTANQKCQNDSEAYRKELSRYTPWALRMYDASAKLSSGIITGNYKQLGNYDECLSVRNDTLNITGQACSMRVKFTITGWKNREKSQSTDIGDLFSNMAVASNATTWRSGETVPFEWLFCIPSSCNYKEFQKSIEASLAHVAVKNRVDVKVIVEKTFCHTLETDMIVFDTIDWMYIAVVAIFASIIIVSTIYDVIMQDTENEFLTVFSLYKNAKYIMSTNRRRDFIDCIDGIRFIAICWIIYGHTYYMEVTSMKMDLTHIVKMHHYWISMLILNGTVSTDIFFVLSGTVLTYTAMLKKNANPNEPFNVIGLYVHRYVRLTPAYFMIIGFYATLLDKISSGPYWNELVGSNRNFCRDNWWINLLYLNNYINIDRMCMSQTWYLAVDMQLYWISPLFLYPLLKFKKITIFSTLIVSIFILSVFLPFATTFLNRLTGTMLYYKESIDVTNVYLQIYTKTYNRAGPFIIGLGFGYFLFKTRHSIKNISLFYVGIGWLIAALVGVSTIFGPIGMYQENYQYNRLGASFYAGLHRHSFALCISWIIFTCVHGYAGPIGNFLSWRIWVPLSKLTYCAYLTHYVSIFVLHGSLRTAGVLTTPIVTHAYFGHMVVVIILSMIWSLCFEIPFINLDKLLTKRDRRRVKTENNNEYPSNQFQPQEKVFNASVFPDQSSSSLTSTQGTLEEINEKQKPFKNRRESLTNHNDSQYRLSTIKPSKNISMKDNDRSIHTTSITLETTNCSKSLIGIDNRAFNITDDQEKL